MANTPRVIHVQAKIDLIADPDSTRLFLQWLEIERRQGRDYGAGTPTGRKLEEVMVAWDLFLESRNAERAGI